MTKKTIKLKYSEIKKYLNEPGYSFPKYSTQILNLANSNSQATRPKIVGQMSDLIREFPGRYLKEWEQWYLEKYPQAIEKATEKIINMIDYFKKVVNDIDKSLIEEWLRDLVIVKTFIGLKFQEAIIRKVAEIKNQKYRLSTPQEESKGIGGYIGNIPVSIKPETYKAKPALLEDIKAKIIFYKKVKDGIEIDFSDIEE